MRRSIATLLILAAPLAAQGSHPNFSGKWTFDAERSTAGAPVAALAVSQTDRSLTFDQSLTNGGVTKNAKFIWRLDGSTSKNSIPGAAGNFEVTSTAAWEGSVLVVTSVAQVQGNEVRNVQRWSLDSSGKVLTLDTAISSDGRSLSTKQVFKKS